MFIPRLPSANSCLTPEELSSYGIGGMFTDLKAQVSEYIIYLNLREELYASRRGTAEAQGRVSDTKKTIEELKLPLCKYTTDRLVVDRQLNLYQRLFGRTN